ncbi:sigma-70 family RNA polymerase sigma factor [Ruminococcus sp.]|uniref:sigma-70 family RNA polymerase sigma factor n=1 Tax=Ruminococcus sp. TaxID=41978 RepID=UPI0025EA97A5|nr:sigma-70 family RNA polymerase sigma factor [Ruminococcus sp.]MBR1433382.1 sigma-70 family RNA polymerase sigma factor [Ruminococcus sp.]
MDEKKYKVTCGGKEVEVTEEVYRLYVTEPESERRLIRKKKLGKIDVDDKNEKVSFILCREDSLERLMELGVEIEDTNDSIAALETADSVHKALARLNKSDRYIIESLFFYGYTEKDVAEKLKTSQANINQRKHRILLKLNKFMRNL